MPANEEPLPPRREPPPNEPVPPIVPPPDPHESRDHWINAGTAILESVRGGELHPAMTWFAKMATAYRHDKPDEFNSAIAEYKQWLGQRLGPELAKGRREFFYNNVQPFLHATIMYIFAFVPRLYLPYQMNMIWHDHKRMNLYSIIYYQETKATMARRHQQWLNGRNCGIAIIE